MDTTTTTTTNDKPSMTAASTQLAQIHEHVSALFAGAVIPDMIELAMATAISPRVVPDGPPVWLLLEGSASNGKTEAAETLRDTAAWTDALTVFVEKVSYASLTQGYAQRVGNKVKRAAPLLRAFHRCCWVNPEFSTLLGSRPENAVPILSTLTAAFDGKLESSFGNVTEQGSPVLVTERRFSLLGCITPAVRHKHADLLAHLGPRFLSYRLLPLTRDEQRQANALARDGERPARLKSLRELISAHLRAIVEQPVSVVIPEHTERILEALAALVARGRTVVKGEGEHLEIGDTEGTSRVYQQLRALLMSLTLVEGATTPSARALRLVRDVALSSFHPQRAEALLVQRESPVVVEAHPATGLPAHTYWHALTVPTLADCSGLSPSTAGRVLHDLMHLGLYVKADPAKWVLIADPQAGKPPVVYIPKPALANVLNATFESWPPRLITAPDFYRDEGDSYGGRLSPPDARLAEEMQTRRKQAATKPQASQVAPIPA